ncbi:hypothetical protein [Thalassospira alkalitolerans]|uniref:hypothetical protein n=1 Tax=Thalassospira alkalitolerans TaxID=1293890 RepID=UPI003AA95D1C
MAMRAAPWILTAVLILCAVPLRAQAKDVRLCYDNWSPYAYEDHGVARGLAVDIATEFLSDAGYSVTFVQMPLARCHFSVHYGAMDGVLLDDQMASEDGDLLTSAVSLASRVTVAVVRTSSKLESYQGAHSLDNTNWLKVIGRTYPPEILANETMHPVRVAEYAKGFEMLKRAYVDVLFTDLAHLRFENTDQASLSSSKVLLPAINVSERYLSLRVGLEPIMEDFDREMSRGLLTGVVDEIYHRHLGFSRVGFARYVGMSDVAIANPAGLIVQ